MSRDIVSLAKHDPDLFFRAQLQQLESRLRYSRTDKETAEKKQKILIDKDLVDFQEKLDAYEVGLSRPSFLKSFDLLSAQDQSVARLDCRPGKAHLQTTRTEK